MKTSTLVLRFAIVGTLNFLVITVIVWLLMHVDVDYKMANVVGYTIAQIHNFVWCKYWIFPIMEGPKRSTMKQIGLFLVAFACSFGAQFLLTVTLVEKLNFNEYVGQFIGLLLYGVINFTMNRRLTFK